MRDLEIREHSLSLGSIDFENSYPHRNTNVNWQNYELFLRLMTVDRDNSHFYYVNAVGKMIWMLSEGELTGSQIIKKISGHFNLSYDCICSDALAFLKKMNKRCLIDFSNEPIKQYEKYFNSLFKEEVTNIRHYCFPDVYKEERKKIRKKKYYFKDKKLWRYIYDTTQKKRFFYPPTILLDITYKCTQQCRFCYLTDDAGTVVNRDISIENLSRIVDIAVQSHVQTLGFIGAEPLDSKHFDTILAYATKKGFKVKIFSNGLSIDRHIEILKKYKPWISISLDGASERTHDSLRGKGSFKKTTENIRLAVKNDIPVKLAFTVTRRNFWDLFKIYNLGRSLKVPLIYTQQFNIIGRGKENKDQFALGASHKLIYYIYSYLHELRQFMLSWLNVKLDTEYNIAGVLGCDAFEYMNISPNGDVHFCVKMPKSLPLGNAFKCDLVYLWNSNEYSRLFDLSLVKEPCKNCIFRNGCTRGCKAELYANTGDFFAGNIFCAHGKISDFIRKASRPFKVFLEQGRLK